MYRELNRALLLNGTFVRRRQLMELMRRYDEDGSGTLDFEVSIVGRQKTPEVLQS